MVVRQGCSLQVTIWLNRKFGNHSKLKGSIFFMYIFISIHVSLCFKLLSSSANSRSTFYFYRGMLTPSFVLPPPFITYTFWICPKYIQTIYHGNSTIYFRVNFFCPYLTSYFFFDKGTFTIGDIQKRRRRRRRKKKTFSFVSNIKLKTLFISTKWKIPCYWKSCSVIN